MITRDDGRNIISAAEKKAASIDQPMNIAIADAGGNLIRMSGWTAFGSTASAFPSTRASGEQDQSVAEAGAAAFR